MNRLMLFLLLLSFLSVTPSAFAAQAKLTAVVDGDTILAETGEGAGKGIVEIQLRCSDAPTLASPYGKEAQTHLQSLLSSAAVFEYKVIDYCSSSSAASSCVRALVYLPAPEPGEEVPEANYINVQMIAAGMARNDGCRGIYSQAQNEAKGAKLGFWSTTQKVVFADTPSPEPAKTATKPDTTQKKPAAVTAGATSGSADSISYSLVDRTVTIKSQRISLSKAVEVIDKVSTLPVNVYLKEPQFLSLNLHQVSWQSALQTIVRAADLKQMNVNGKIELYTAAFYYENIAQHLKVSGGDGVYISVRSGDKAKPAADDGSTHYVYVNDYKNRAEQPGESDASGFIQAHDGSTAMPVSNEGVFERSDTVKPPVEQAPTVAEKTPSPPPPPLPVPKGTKSPTASAPVEVDDAQQPPPAKQVENPPPAAAEKSDKQPQKSDEKPQTAPGGPAEKPAAPAKEPGAVETGLSIGTSEMIALAVIVLVVVGGGFLLMRSADRAKRAAEQKKVEIPDPWKTPEPEDEPVQEIDEAYEKEILEELEHVEDAPAAKPVVEVAKQEVTEVEVAKESPPPAAPAAKKGKNPKKKSNLAGVVVTEGNYNVTLDDYEKYMVPPNREPRQDCLFEVKYSVGGEPIDGIGLDISRGGIFIDSKEEYEIGTEIEFEFSLRDSDPQPISGKGVITWRNERPDPIKPNYPNGFGVQFAELAEGVAELVEAYMATLEADQGE